MDTKTSYRQLNYMGLPLGHNNIIIAPVEPGQLCGALIGFCHFAGCAFKELVCNQYIDFLNILKTEKPRIVFIHLSQFNQIITTCNYSEIQHIVRKDNIIICGIGDMQNYPHLIHAKTLFSSIFEEPLNIDAIIEFIKHRLHFINDRRARERRKGGDRRNQLSVIENPVKTNELSIADQETINKKLVTTIGIDYKSKRILVYGKAFETTPKEFLLVDYLLKNKGRVVGTDEILKSVWPENCRATKADVHQYIYILRNKLEKNPQNPQLLITVKGFGYKLGA